MVNAIFSTISQIDNSPGSFVEGATNTIFGPPERLEWPAKMI